MYTVSTLRTTHNLVKVSNTLSRLLIRELQLDCTYKAIASVRAMLDWRNFAYRSYVNTPCAADINHRNMHVVLAARAKGQEISKDSLTKPVAPRQFDAPSGSIVTAQAERSEADKLSTAQFVICDEWEFIHQVLPCNGQLSQAYTLLYTTQCVNRRRRTAVPAGAGTRRNADTNLAARGTGS